VPVSAYIVKTVNAAGPLGPAHKKVVGVLGRGLKIRVP
jgi:hypothetical protein